MRIVFHAKELLFIFSLLLASVLEAQESVLTQHNNNNRTGWYDKETVLNKTNVGPGSFGKLFARPVDDQIYAQPLVMLNLAIPGHGNKNIVFVATVNNTIYAFDADSANVSAPYWQINLTPANSRVVNRSDETGACGGFYRDFSGNMGIVGTPVIDSTTNTLYVVARSVDSLRGVKNFKQYLHAIDITTGSERPNSPVLITAVINGTGDGSLGGKISFNSLHQNQRAGLLLTNGIVYIVWSAHCDWSPYHGWLMGYDKTTLQQKYIYSSTPDGYGGGIWMGGGGPSSDETGSIYLAVGNGSVGKNGDPTDLSNRSESALKLAPSGSSFTIQSYFTPKNYETLEGADLDFGVTQFMLIPNTNRAVVGGKDGHIYVLDRNNMGGYNSVADNVLQTINLGSNAFLRSSMSYFKGSTGYVYSWSENSLLHAFPYDTTSNLLDVNNTILSGLQGPTGNNGAVLSVSSNGSSDSTGVLWASYAANGDANQSVRPGILRAIDANDVRKELWNSSVDPNDNPGNYAKFSCPTIANGKVYLPTFSNQLVVYGLTGGAPNTCNLVNIALNKPVVVSSIELPDLTGNNATDGNLNTRWSSQFSDPQYIYIDLGKRYDICRVILHWETALGQDFKIQVSDDASVWSDAATITGNASFINYIPVSASGRYVRLYGTKRGTPYGYSLYEFEVNGTPSVITCITPVNLTTSNVFENTATLNWSISGASKYLVKYKTVTAINWSQVLSNANTVTLNGLACNTPYQFQVQGVCSASDSSDFSTPLGFTTLDCNSSCDPLPTRWSTQDIGNTGIAGSACYTSSTGTFELHGSGSDIAGTQDAFRYAYKTVTVGGDIIARVASLDNANASNKTGIMLRETLAEGSRYAFIGLTSASGVVFQTRTITDGNSNTIVTGTAVRAPYWLKLSMLGSTATAYISPDGFVWTKVGNGIDIGFESGQPVYGGIAITSHDNSALSTADIDNVNIDVAVLPLTLISFKGRLTLNNTAVLDWITTRETGTNYFIVERTKDNWNYKSIDTVYAENNGEYTQDYSATDLHPLSGTNYYRLKIVDMNGKISYSPIVAIKVGNTRSPVMYPNPASSVVTIAPGSDGIRQVNVYNILGRTVLKIPDAGSGGTIQIPTYSFANGLYFVEIRTANLVYVERLLIHH